MLLKAWYEKPHLQDAGTSMPRAVYLGSSARRRRSPSSGPDSDGADLAAGGAAGADEARAGGAGAGGPARSFSCSSGAGPGPRSNARGQIPEGATRLHTVTRHACLNPMCRAMFDSISNVNTHASKTKACAKLHMGYATVSFDIRAGDREVGGPGSRAAPAGQASSAVPQKNTGNMLLLVC